MAGKTQVVATRLFDFVAVLAGRHLITSTVGASFDPVVLSLDRTPDYRKVTNHAGFPKKRADSPNNFRVHHSVDGDWPHVDLPPTTENYHDVQPLPQGEWLLVRGRASGKTDCNAHVYAADGQHMRSFHTGDGIADVQATERGRIWVSYFDEGVFGDTPLGQSGLACLDSIGHPIFRFTQLGDPVVQSMADCYALNVCSDRETWLYYYTDFPLVKVFDCKLAGSWLVPVGGSHAFAVDGERVLFAGSYKEKDLLFLWALGAAKPQKLTPIDEDGTRVQGFRPFGRRHHLYLATETALYVVDLLGL